MHDAITAERHGTPAVGVMTTGFVDAAEIMARACGLAGYRFAVIEHPVASATDEQLRERAVAAVTQGLDLLLMDRLDG
ncbi:MAG: hypothetical protein GEV08_18700 [Acidimicrobiia bacterium]|nr:hypothetical protein [Acidimicrobiia bacterium]